MIRLFKHYLPRPLLLLGLLELATLALMSAGAWIIRTAQIDMSSAIGGEEIGQLAVIVATMAISMVALGAYQNEAFRSWRVLFTRLGGAVLVSIVIISVISFFIPNVGLWRSVAIYSVALGALALLGLRAMFLSLIGWQSFRQPVIAIGAGTNGARLRRLADDPGAVFKIVKHLRVSEKDSQVQTCGRLGDYPSLARLCDENDCGEIVVALDERRGGAPTQPLLEAKLSGIQVSDMSSFLERMTGRVDLGSVSPSWLIYSDGFLGASSFAVASKRLFDLVSSALLLVLTSPILLVSAVIVKLTSPGPVLYRQERVGQFGKTFHVVKFRSMVQDAEREGAQWAQERDPRVTAFGRFMRATRIDELPQIFNVLRGDMSFVGPRPERPVFVAELSERIPFYNERHVVKPGIAGWAQLNYPYGASLDDARHKLEYDLYYIKNYSLFLDFAILMQTVRVVVWQDGVR